MENLNNNSPANKPESINTEKEVLAKIPDGIKNLTEEQLVNGDAVKIVTDKAAEDTNIETPAELPLFKLHASLEVLEYVKAEDLPAAIAKLKELKLGDRLKPGQITFLEQIPYEQYKNFKVEIID